MLMDNQLKRNPSNPNQILHWLDQYRGFSVQVSHGPLVVQYLDSLLNAISLAQAESSRVFAVRLDLRFSDNLGLIDNTMENEVIRKFIESLKAKLDWRDRQTLKNKGRVNSHRLRYVWARETGPKSGNLHYHLVLLLNGDAYRSIGDFSDSGVRCLYSRVREAWASAIGLSYERATGLVTVPSKASWMLHRDDFPTLNNFIHAASYLCKTETKQFGSGVHGFGVSRR